MVALVGVLWCHGGLHRVRAEKEMFTHVQKKSSREKRPVLSTNIDKQKYCT